MELLSKSSVAEKVAYSNLTKLGYEVIRQQPIQTGRRIYFADMYIPTLKTIVEIDGGYHTTNKQRKLDKNRSSGIWRLGYHVLRLSNHDVRDINKVRRKIMVLDKRI